MEYKCILAERNMRASRKLCRPRRPIHQIVVRPAKQHIDCVHEEDSLRRYRDKGCVRGRAYVKWLVAPIKSACGVAGRVGRSVNQKGSDALPMMPAVSPHEAQACKPRRRIPRLESELQMRKSGNTSQIAFVLTGSQLHAMPSAKNSLSGRVSLRSM